MILKSKAKETGIEDVSPHDLRRTFVKSLLEPGNDIMFVAALGGLGIAVPAGAIPYPGAVAVIFFALFLHISLRMGVTISVTGVIVILAKRGVVRESLSSWALCFSWPSCSAGAPERPPLSRAGQPFLSRVCGGGKAPPNGKASENLIRPAIGVWEGKEATPRQRGGEDLEWQGLRREQSGYANEGIL